MGGRHGDWKLGSSGTAKWGGHERRPEALLLDSIQRLAHHRCCELFLCSSSMPRPLLFPLMIPPATQGTFLPLLQPQDRPIAGSSAIRKDRHQITVMQPKGIMVLNVLANAGLVTL